MAMAREKIMELVNDLYEYAILENGEYGEYCLMLCAVLSDYRYFIWVMEDALIEEIEIHIKNFNENANIVEKEVASTQKYKTIEWK